MAFYSIIAVIVRRASRLQVLHNEYDRNWMTTPWTRVIWLLHKLCADGIAHEISLIDRQLLKNQVFSAHTSANRAEGAFWNTKNAPNSLFLMRNSRGWYNIHRRFGFKRIAMNWEVNHERNSPHTRANRTLDDPPNWRTIEMKVMFKTKCAFRLHDYECSNWPHLSERHNEPLDSAVW